MKARRGDLVAVVSTVRDYVIGQGSTEREQVTLGQVTSITREGVVRIAKYLDLGGGTLYDAARSHDQVLVIPADAVDPDALADAYCARRYPSAPHSRMVPPFSSLSECRSFIRNLKALKEAV